MSQEAGRMRLVAAARRSVELGLNHGTTGNLSMRWGDGFLITASGLPCDGLTVADLVAMPLAGPPASGQREPSSEWRLHRDLYLDRPDIQAVVHAHPVYATTLACLRRDLPAVHYMIAISGAATVRCAPYAMFGTRELSDATIVSLGRGKACLLANHGLVAVGTDLDDALRVATEVENVAELYWRAAQLGEPAILGEEEMAQVLDRFQTYGR